MSMTQNFVMISGIDGQRLKRSCSHILVTVDTGINELRQRKDRFRPDQVRQKSTCTVTKECLNL